MRARPLFVRHAPLRSLRRAARALKPRRAGVVGPLAVAVALAVAGYDVTAPAPTTSVSAADLPDHTASAAPRIRTRSNVVARTQPKAAATKRASRSKPRAAVVTRAWVRPSSGPLTSRYGQRWGRMHRGLDFGAPYGAPIYAASSGVVTFAGARGGYGRLVTIRHSGGYTTAYGHMSRIAVRYGQRVTAGQVIAYTGSAGQSTGPHLHFEVRTGGDGSQVNPMPFLRARGVYV